MGLEFGNPERPEADICLGSIALLSNRSASRRAWSARPMGWGQFKPLLGRSGGRSPGPLQERYGANPRRSQRS